MSLITPESVKTNDDVFPILGYHQIWDGSYQEYDGDIETKGNQSIEEQRDKAHIQYRCNTQSGTLKN